MSVFIMKKQENGSYSELKTPKMARRSDAMKYLRENIDKPNTNMSSTDELMVVGNPTKVKASTETKVRLTATKKARK